MWFTLFLCLGLFLSANGKVGFGPGEQDYGYVNVRDGAHMFWWLYHTTANVTNSAERPLILWLQGGPGGSSCGYGNFEILGPLDLDLQPRDHTWVKDFNLLLVDNPVGTGYSYVDSFSYLTTDNTQIAKDLLEVVRSVYETLPQFKSTPLYVYGQSYGVKMAIEFAEYIYKEQKAGNIKSNISGVAMGNSWISPLDSTLSWSEFLYHVSLVDRAGAIEIDQAAQKAKEAYDKGDYKQSTKEWSKTEGVVLRVTEGVDFYNILTKPTKGFWRNQYHRSVHDSAIDRATFSKYLSPRTYDLDTLMNGQVKEALNIPSKVYWGSQANAVFTYLEVDFMKPVTHIVERVLNNTDLKVQIYNGNIDLIVDTPGQKAWSDNLRWDDEQLYRKASRKGIWVNNTLEGYKRVGGGLGFYWINVAGHSVPADNPAGMREVLRDMTGF